MITATWLLVGWWLCGLQTRSQVGNAVLSKVENHGPSTVDRWVVRVTFVWSVYYVVRNDNETTISQCVIYSKPVTKKRKIDISNPPIACKFDRWLSSNAAKPHLPYFKVQDWSIMRHHSQLREFKRHKRS